MKDEAILAPSSLSRSARRSITKIVGALILIEDFMPGGDSYTAVPRTGKPESREPGNIAAATHHREIERQLKSIAHSTERSLRRLARESVFRMERLCAAMDANRDHHDYGTRPPSRAQLEAGVVRHLSRKYGQEETP